MLASEKVIHPHLLRRRSRNHRLLPCSKETPLEVLHSITYYSPENMSIDSRIH